MYNWLPYSRHANCVRKEKRKIGGCLGAEGFLNQISVRNPSKLQFYSVETFFFLPQISVWKRLKSENWHAWYKDKIIFILFFRMKICNMPEPVWIFKVLSERRLYFCLNFSFLFQLLRMLHLSGSTESWGSRLEVLDEMWATLLNKFFFFLIHSERDTSGMNVVLQHAGFSRTVLWSQY